VGCDLGEVTLEYRVEPPWTRPMERMVVCLGEPTLTVEPMPYVTDIFTKDGREEVLGYPIIFDLIRSSWLWSPVLKVWAACGTTSLGFRYPLSDGPTEPFEYGWNMSPQTNSAKYRAVSAGAFLSGVVGMDLFLNFLCSGFPLLLYLVIGGLGAWFGGARHAWLSRDSGGAKFVRRVGVFLALFSVCGIAVQFVLPVNWGTKCSWRYCGRAMGPGLLQSPFPVGTPDCGAWHMCANEYQFTPVDYDSALQRMKRQGCAAP